MKFTVAGLVLAALTTKCFAQTVNITSPPNHISVAPGGEVKLVVEYNESFAGARFDIALISNLTEDGNDGKTSNVYIYKSPNAFNKPSESESRAPDAPSPQTGLRQNINLIIPFNVTDHHTNHPIKIANGYAEIRIGYMSLEVTGSGASTDPLTSKATREYATIALNITNN